MSTKNILLSGFGGQGILFAGKLLAYKGLIRTKTSAGFPLTVRKCAEAPQAAASL